MPLSRDSGLDEGVGHPGARKLLNALWEALERNGVRKLPKEVPNLRAGRLLLETDKVPLAEAERVLAWCQQNDFWKVNILSLEKFRKQYDRLRLAMGQEESKRPARSPHLYD